MAPTADTLGAACSPSIAQFLTVDPMVATTLSPYGYVAGNPLNAGDPSGLCGWAPWEWLSCLVSNSIQSQRELAHPTAGQELQNLANLAAILNMEDGAGEAIEGCELGTEGVSASSLDAIANGDRVGSGLQTDPFHSAPTWANPADVAANGQEFTITGGDGVARTLVQSPATVNDIAGRFEWIINPNGTISHQLFVPGGGINGAPILP